MPESELPTVTVAALPTELPASAILLDVRENDEWQHGHAPGALHIPMGDVPSRLGELNPDAELYVVCKGGGRSARVVQYLAQAGYEATNVDGGMMAWQASGRPVTRDDGEAASIL